MALRLKQSARRAAAKPLAGRFIAVDWEAGVLRLAQADHSGSSTRFRKLVTTRFDAASFGDADAMGEVLRDAIAEHRLKGSTVMMSLPRRDALLKPLNLPKADSIGELAGMVRFQVEREVSFDTDEAVIDFTLEPHVGPSAGEGNLDILAAAVKRSVIERYQRIAEVAGVQLHRLGLRSYSDVLAAWGSGQLDRSKTGALVHLTTDSVEINITAGNALVFTRTVASSEAANGSRAQAVAAEVWRSIQSYAALQTDKPVRQIVIAGDTGVETALLEALGKQTRQVDLQLFDPVKALRLKPNATQGGAAGYIACLGLAIGDHRENDLRFDFLNPKQPLVRKRRKLSRKATLAAAAVTVIVGLGAISFASLQAKRAAVNKLKAEVREKQPEHKKMRVLDRQVRLIDQWRDQQHDWLDHWANLSAQLPPAELLYITSLGADGDGAIIMQVRARTADTLAALAQNLQQAGYEQMPAAVIPVNDPYGYNYSTTVKLIAPTGMDIALADLSPPARPSDDMTVSQFVESGDSKRARQRAAQVTPAVAPVPAAPAASEAPAEPAAKVAPRSSADRRRELMQRYDTDRNGQLSREERRAMYDDMRRRRQEQNQ